MKKNLPKLYIQLRKKMGSAKNFFLILLIFIPFLSEAQFNLNGSARQISQRCFQLTDERLNIVGSIWDTTKINLNESFEVSLDLFFGCRDFDGADGIVFGFQPVGTSIGSVGEGIGFLNVTPSIGIEMDTYQNSNLNDPSFDHMAIIRNGDVNHSRSNTLAGPVSIGTNGNIEDCQSHIIKVRWDATLKKLEASFDCKPLLSYTGDIVNDIFNGNPLVFWGFTAATGGSFNRQEVCLQYTTFLDKPSKQQLCKGDTIRLNASGGVKYKWTPSVGLSNDTIANPIAKPDITTTYRVIVLDRCGVEYKNEVELQVSGDPFAFNIGKDTLLCDGQTITLSATVPKVFNYLWQDGLKDSVRTINKAGSYSVHLSRGFCIGDDTIQIKYLSPPSVKWPTDTFICEDKTLIINAKFDLTTYQWQDGSTLPEFLVQKSGIYSVTMKNKCGIKEQSIMVKKEDCSRLFFPNVFSPNGDNINDVFFPQDGGNVEVIKTMQIFDRWGNLVFEKTNFKPNDPSSGWDGTWKGNQIMAPDVFTYWAEVSFINGVTTIRKGDVTLIR